MQAIHSNRHCDTDRQWSASMVAARAGDRVAYDALFRNCIPLIRRIAQRQGIRPHSVDDVVQDTLFAMYQARHAYDPRRSFTRWISAIARRRAIDGLRRIGRAGAREIHAPLAYENCPDANADPAGRTDELDQIARLAAALHALPAAQRRTVAVVLRSRSFAGAAATVGCRPGSLRVSWHRALAALRIRMVGSDEP